MTEKQKRIELVGEQRAAQQVVTDTLAEMKRFDEEGNGERLDEKRKEAAKAAAKRVSEIGAQIEAIDKQLAKAADDDMEFRRQLTAATGKITATMPVRDAGDIMDPAAGTMELTRETVAAFNDAVRDIAGSRGYQPRVNPKSEQLVRDMLTTKWELRGSRAREWGDRAAQFRTPVATTTDAAGGYLIPDDNTFMTQVQLAERATGGVQRVARIINTMNGAPLPVPDTTATTVTGESVNENTPVNDVTLTFGETVMRQAMVTSGRLEATYQSVEDAGPNLPMLLGIVAGDRMVYRENELFIQGSGVAGQQPQGLEQAYQELIPNLTLYRSHARATANPPFGLTSESGNTTPITTLMQGYLQNIKYAVNAGWRRKASYSWVMNENVDRLFSSATIAADDQRLIWPKWSESNTAKGEGLAMFGMMLLTDFSIRPFPINATAGNTAVAWIGDFGQYWIRKIAGMFMVQDIYTGATSMKTYWTFGRRCDARGLFGSPIVNSTPAIMQLRLTNRA